MQGGLIFVTLCVLFPKDATAAEGWSVLSGRTVGEEQTVIFSQLGWPGVSATLLHGVAPRLDLGARLTFNYGEEGVVHAQLVPGAKLQGVARLTIWDNGRTNLGLHFDPGPAVYFTSYDTTVGVVLPMGIQLGIPVGSALMPSVGVELPIFLTFGTGGGLIFPVLFGAGLEYFVSPHFAATFSIRMGPSVDTRGFRPVASFALEALIGVAYRL